MSQATAAPAKPTYTRKLSNFLLDSKFQLKFAGYFVALTLVVSALLLFFLVRTTDSLYRQVNLAVEAKSKAAQTSKELGQCSLNNDLAKNLDDPDFAATLEAKSKSIDAAYEAEKQAVLSEQKRLEEEQHNTLWALVGFIVAFIAAVGLAAIVLTHRIVGPLFRIKRMAREVSQGIIQPPTYGLRPGDELHDVFEVMATMVKQLRARAEADLASVTAARADPAVLAKLEADLTERLAKK